MHRCHRMQFKRTKKLQCRLLIIPHRASMLAAKTITDRQARRSAGLDRVRICGRDGDGSMGCSISQCPNSKIVAKRTVINQFLKHFLFKQDVPPFAVAPISTRVKALLFSMLAHYQRSVLSYHHANSSYKNML